MGTSANIYTEMSGKITDSVKIDREFKKNIFDNIFFLNLDGLNTNADLVKFSSDSWKYNPQKFSLDFYGTVIFYKVILLVNNIGSQFEFKDDTFINRRIVTPKEVDILKVLSYSRS